MVKRSQTSEFLAADICDSPSLFVTTAATAGTLSSFQRMCGNDMDISTVTAAFPSGSSVLAPNPSYCHKFPESLTCKVFCHRSTSGRFFQNTSTVIHGSSHQTPCIYFYFIPAVTTAQPHNVPVLTFIQSFQHSQMSKSLAFQLKSPVHILHPLQKTAVR